MSQSPTVSKALNGYSDIGEETKNYILRTAFRDGISSQLIGKSFEDEANLLIWEFLFVDEARSGLTHDYFNRVLESFKSTAEAKGYDITFYKRKCFR